MNGAVVQPSTNSTRWAMGELDQQDFFVIDKLKAGEAGWILKPDRTISY